MYKYIVNDITKAAGILQYIIRALRDHFLIGHLHSMPNMNRIVIGPVEVSLVELGDFFEVGSGEALGLHVDMVR